MDESVMYSLIYNNNYFFNLIPNNKKCKNTQTKPYP